MSLPYYHAMMFNRKLEGGIYSTEKVKCFCGADDYTPITDTDRYSFDYKMCLCNKCGILYVNPRMTEDSYRKFYEDDYRGIYGLPKPVTLYGIVQTAKTIKARIYQLIDDYDIDKPKLVYEIGCGSGELLAEFKDCKTLGVDYDKSIITRNNGKNILHGGIELLEKTGEKADLIIMNQVLEHILDLKDIVLRVRKLLKEDGIFYVTVPGLYAWHKDVLFQNAHTYQFNGTTLEYVMQTCGFDNLYLDEGIESLWVKSDFHDLKETIQPRYIYDYLLGDPKKRIMPPLRVSCKFSLKSRKRNTKYIIASGLPQITELINIHPNSEAVIISGGPSINDYVDKIKELISKGAKTYAIERMYQWCLKHDIVPDYVIVMDASDDVIESFRNIHPHTKHIILAQCQPEVVDLLKGKNTYCFFVEQKGVSLGRYLKDAGIKRVTCIEAGGSVSSGTFSMAITLGGRYIHMFGFDCHVTKKDYADGITGVGYISDRIEIEVNDRVFKTTIPYFAFLQAFFLIYQVGIKLGQIKNVKIYGDSLIKASALIDLDGDKNV